jgi:uncharacterized RDD family membrane protein YckC
MPQPSSRQTSHAFDELGPPELFAGVLWRRPLAYLIDLVVIGFLLGAWLWLVLMTLGLLWPVTSLAFLLIPMGYHAYLVGGRHNATLGMRICGLEVRTWDDDRPDAWQALLMAILFYVTVVGTSCLILIVALFNERRRTVHDYLSGVVVTRRVHGLRLVVPEALA